MPYGRHIHAKAYDMAKATVCAYSQWDHMLPHWKCVVRCCDKCSSINLPVQETDYQYPDTSPSISFQIYHLIARCKKHVRLPLNDKKRCHKFQHVTASGKSTKIYTRKEKVTMETTISNIPYLQKLAFYIPHVLILGTNHCGDSRRTAFKRRKLFQDVLCRCDYSERVVASFIHQIQSEHYGGNISIYIEGIALEHSVHYHTQK